MTPATRMTLAQMILNFVIAGYSVRIQSLVLRLPNCEFFMPITMRWSCAASTGARCVMTQGSSTCIVLGKLLVGRMAQCSNRFRCRLTSVAKASSEF